MSEESSIQSNRPYTLFYYSSSKLPPRMTSENEVRRFWCRIDDESTPFFMERGGIEDALQ
jgi:hypothetical protein